MIHTGLVGFGVAAKYMHAPFLLTHKNYAVTHVLERNRNDAASLFPNAKIVRSLDEMLAENSIELVVITTPNETHFPYAMQALTAGKNVVLEKPFTIYSEEASKLIAKAKEVNKIISVYQNRRYVSDFLTLKKILGLNLLGKVHEFEAHYDRYRPEAKANAWREEPKPGSGIFYDLGAHLIDQALVLFGVPLYITADILMQRPHAKADDYFDVRFDYGYTRIILKGGMLVREPGPKYQVHGELGSFIKFGEDPQEALLRAGHLPNNANWGMEDEAYFGLLHTELAGKIIKEKFPSEKGNYGYFYNNLYESLVNNMLLKEKPEHAFNTIRMIELAFESNIKKCTIECTGLLEDKYKI